MSSHLTTKTLRGKYQITKNIFVTCYLDVLDANNNGIQTFIGLKRRADNMVPIGTHIFFDAELINKINIRRKSKYDIFSITVQSLEDNGGRPLHLCTPIQKDSRPDYRKTERKKIEFPVTLIGSQKHEAVFMAQDGSDQGLTLHYTAKKAILSLALDHKYTFGVEYKGEAYRLAGYIKHIQYDWKTHEHIVGVHFPKLKEEERIILNLLVDPEYTIQISDKQTIDTSAGKISAQEEDE